MFPRQQAGAHGKIVMVIKVV